MILSIEVEFVFYIVKVFRLDCGLLDTLILQINKLAIKIIGLLYKF
jgi:hypothetical protein